MKATLIVLLFLPIISMAQLVGLLIPTDYIKKHRIREITEIEVNSNDTMPKTYGFYENGLLAYRSSYTPKNRYKAEELSPNFCGEYLKYYEHFYYDSINLLKLSVASWDGFKEPQIFTAKTEYSENGDTVFSIPISHKTGHDGLPSSHLNQKARDTVLLEDNKYALIGYNSDTLGYKHIYHINDCDSVVYLYDSEKEPYYYTYVVYKNELIIRVGMVSNIKKGNEYIVNRSTYYTFNNKGYPIKGIEYWLYDTVKTHINIKYKTYKKK